MAPEQALGVPVDPRADLYPVGVMLWQAIAGRRRWPAGLNEAAILTRLGSGDPPESPDSAAHGLPAELDDLVCKSLMPDRDARFKDAGEFIDALEGILRTLPPVSPRALGAMLSDAFADDRQRLQEVIEQQFRLLQTGRSPEPHLLPTLPPPRFSGSSLSGGTGPTGISGDSDSGKGQVPDDLDLAIPIDSGTQALHAQPSSGTLASAHVSATRKTKQQRSFTIAGILGGALLVVGAMAVFLRAGQTHSGGGSIAAEGPSATAASLGSAASPISSAATAATTPPVIATVGNAGDTASAAARDPHSGDTRVHAGPAHAGGTTHSSTATTAQTQAAAATTAAVAADPPHPAPSATAAPGIDLTQHQAEKRKVQLDPDNPWH
jgi:serine/threonine-protein kinase